MNNLAAAINISRFNKSSVLVTGLVVVMVVGLFFIPELVDFQFSGSSSRSSESPLATSANVDQSERRVVRVQEPPAVSPLAQVSALIDNGYIDRLVQERAGRTPGSTSDSAATENALAGRAVSWSDIREGEVKTTLYTARDDASKLAAQLPVRFVNSKFALLSLVSGIDMILSNAQGSMQPQQGLEYLEWLSQSVNDTMIREGVERADFVAWKNVNLGPLLQASRAHREKAQIHMAFSPQLTLDRVTVFKPADRFGHYQQKGPVNVNIAGHFKSRDVKRIAIFGNGRFMREVFYGPGDKEGESGFSLIEVDGTQVITFKVWDVNGSVYEKSYLFYPKARRFAWSPVTYFFAVPFKFGDPNVDRFFRYHGAGNKSERERAYGVF